MNKLMYSSATLRNHLTVNWNWINVEEIGTKKDFKNFIFFQQSEEKMC